MSIEKHILSSLTGNSSSTINKNNIFSQIDDKILEIIDTILYEDISSEDREALLRDIVSNTDEGSLGNLLIKSYGLSGIQDPVLSVSGRYFYVDTFNSTIQKNNPDLNPFSFFVFTINDKNLNGYSINNFSSYSNDIEVSIDNTKFQTFIINYLPKLYEYIRIRDIFGVGLSVASRILSPVFLKSFEAYVISSNKTNFNYSNYISDVLDNKKITNINRARNYNGYELTTNYNFYIKEYEETFNKFFSYERILPNFYAIEDYVVYENGKSLPHLTLNNSVNITKQNIATQEYYSNFANAVSANNEIIRLVQNNFKDYLLDTKFISTQQKQITPELTPYNVQVNFETSDLDNTILNYNTLNDLNFLTLNNIYYGFTNPTQNNINTYNLDFKTLSEIDVKVKDDTGTFADLDGSRYNITTTKSISDKRQTGLQYSDIYKFVDIGDTGFVRYSGIAFSFTDFNSDSIKGPDSLFTFLGLQSVVENEYEKYIDYKNIFNLNELEVDSLSYFVEKQGNQYIGLSKQSDLLNYSFIDSQVVYDKDIEYRVYSSNLVPQTIHRYVSVETDLTNLKSTISVNVQLNPIIYNDLFFKETIKVIDNPPLAPHVRFVPYEFVSNTIGMWFNNSFGSYQEAPTYILPSDSAVFESVSNNQKLFNGKIFFESNDLVKEIQVFYTNAKPENYNDFANANLVSLEMENKTSKETRFNIEPNIKYYFAFRSIDVHNLISNPSSVFEVELVENDGAVYSIINTIDLQNKKDYDNSKSFRKYLHIKPSFEYLQIVPTNESITEAKLGNQQDLWGKKYKIRVTSKKSGKCFDINLSFVKEEKDLT